VASSWSVPVLGPGGLLGVITVFRAMAGPPRRDDLDLATLYAGFVASAVDRDRLLDEATARNRVLETIREMLQILGGPVPVAEGLGAALQALRRGLEAAEVALLTQPPDGPVACRAAASDAAGEQAAASLAAVHAAAAALAVAEHDGAAVRSAAAAPDGEHLLAVAFPAPAGRSALVARWAGGPPPDATALLEDAAHSLRLAVEREAASLAIQETAALRRSQELQRGFLSRLSHELRTPLTAIRGYASSLLQPDVSWDAESQQRFLTRIAAESSRLGRLVDDLLRFSAIESGILQLQRDWCSIPLVLDAAIACLPPADARLVEVDCADRLPPVWADHDRLEQVFVNLLSNATSHNPAGTRVMVSAAPDGPDAVLVTVADDGQGLPADVAQGPFEPMRRRHRAATSGSGLGLSIARGIVTAHGGRMELAQPARGTCIRIHLPVENPGPAAEAAEAVADA
jgi:signal transduction histidine kinase